MKLKKLIVFLWFIFFLLGCETGDLSLDKNPGKLPVKETETSVIKKDFSVSRTDNEYDIGSGIALLPDNRIWATGGWNAPGNVLYFSSDAGKNWETKIIPVEKLSTTASITFTDSDNGWAVGWLRIVKTNDGGLTWKKVELPDESAMTDLQSIRFFDSQVGFIGGTTGHINKDTFDSIQGIEILCTDNAGTKWNVCYKNNKYTSIYSIVISENSDVFGLVDSSLLLVSEDRGKLWNEIYLNTPANSIAVNNQGTIWLVGEGGFQFSNDKGRTWSNAEVGLQNKEKLIWNSLDFNSRGIGIAVGDNGRIAVTKNNGQTWEIKTDISTEKLLKIKMADSFALLLGEKKLYMLDINE